MKKIQNFRAEVDTRSKKFFCGRFTTASANGEKRFAQGKEVFTGTKKELPFRNGRRKKLRASTRKKQGGLTKILGGGKVSRWRRKNKKEEKKKKKKKNSQIYIKVRRSKENPI